MRLFQDRLGKALFSEVLSPFTQVEVGAELLPNSFSADVLVQPTGQLPEDLAGAGLLSRLIQGRVAVIEPYSGSLDPKDLRTCLAKLELALVQALSRRQGAEPYPRGCLLVVASGNPELALRECMDGAGRELELGLLQWRELDPVYLVRADVLEERPETLLFRLLARGERQLKAVDEVYARHVKPYQMIVHQFYRRFEEMSTETAWFKGIDPQELEELQRFGEAVEAALRQQGRQEGSLQAKLEIAKQLFAEGEPLERVLRLTGLKPEELEHYMK